MSFNPVIDECFKQCDRYPNTIPPPSAYNNCLDNCNSFNSKTTDMSPCEISCFDTCMSHSSNSGLCFAECGAVCQNSAQKTAQKTTQKTTQKVGAISTEKYRSIKQSISTGAKIGIGIAIFVVLLLIWFLFFHHRN